LPLAVLQSDDWLPTWPLRRLKAVAAIPFRALALAFSPRYPRVLVLEYGTHWKGHLHRLTRIAPPKIAVVTTIGPAHLERLGTEEGVMQEKSALVRAAPRDGLVVLGDDHAFVHALERLSAAPVVRVSGRGVELARRIAATIGRHLGLSDTIIDAGLNGFEAPKARLQQFATAGMIVIDDSYNANPMSMKLGLDELSLPIASGERRVAVLGAMSELGDQAQRYHQEVAAYARSRCDLLIGVGELARDYAPDHWFADSAATADALPGLLRPGDRILIKGSHSVAMSIIAKRLRQMQAPQIVPSLQQGASA